MQESPRPESRGQPGGGASGPLAVPSPVRSLIRPRLLDAVGAHRVTIVSAPAGFGKTTLIGQCRDSLGMLTCLAGIAEADREIGVFLSSLRRVLRRCGLSDLAGVIESADPAASLDRLLDGLDQVAEPVLVVVDDVHRLDRVGVDWLRRWAEGLTEPHRLVLATRLDVERSGLGGTEHLTLGAGDLAFDEAEVDLLLRSRRVAAVRPGETAEVLRRTQGWPVAVALVASGRSTAGAAVGDLVDAAMDRLDPADRRVVVQLAHLPTVTRTLVAVVERALAGEEERQDSASAERSDPPSTDLVARLTAAGVPLTELMPLGWELAEPAAAHLRRQGPLDPRVARAAAHALDVAGRPAVAVRLLITSGCLRDAADLLTMLSPDALEDVGTGELAGLVDSLPDETIAINPLPLVLLSQLADTDDADLRERALDRLDRVCGPGLDPVVARQVAAERARDLSWDERTRAEAVRLAEGILAQAGPDETAARARALDVAGRCASWYLPWRPDPAAAAMLEESIRLSRSLGRRTWVAQAQVPLAIGVHVATGRYQRADEVLREALATLPRGSRTRALVLSFHADVLAHLGRFDEAEAVVAEISEIGGDLGDERVLAYAAWSTAIIAGLAGDVDGLVTAVGDVERHRGAWFEQEAGAEFLANAAYLLDRAGHTSLGTRYAARARGRQAAVSLTTRVFLAQVEARSGSAAAARAAIADLLRDELVEPRDRPYLMLLDAEAARRTGEAVAGQLAGDAFDALLDLGDTAGEWLREPALVEALLPPAIDAGSGAARLIAARRGQVTILTLGRLEIRCGGRPVRLPPGRPTDAMAVIVANDGRMRAEALIEALWPDLPADVGHNRLRNLLSRIRTACPELLTRDGRAIRLQRNCDVDARRLTDHVRAMGASARPDEALAHAAAAIALYRGDFLPDHDDDVVADARFGHRADYLAAVDVAAGIIESRGDVDGAIRLLERGIAAEPADEQRYLRLIQLLVRNGRLGTARGVVGRTYAALVRVGLPGSFALAAVAAGLGMAADRASVMQPVGRSGPPLAARAGL